jgi:hypothetical protein
MGILVENNRASGTKKKAQISQRTGYDFILPILGSTHT